MSNQNTPIESMAICSIILLLCFYNIITIGVDVYCRVEAALKIEEGYSTYLEGELVDGTKLDISQYIVEIDDENNIVKLTKNNLSYLPTKILWQ